MSASEPRARQSNPFLPGWEPEPWQEAAMREAMNSPEGRKMIQSIADEVDAAILEEIKREARRGFGDGVRE